MKNPLIVFRNFSWCCIVFMLFPACAPSDKAYEVLESGLQYKFHIQNEAGAKPKEGDVVKIKMIYKTDKDSLLFNSNDKSRDGSGAIEFPLGPSTFKGSFEEAIGMMCVGDSASFRISADSIFLKTFGAKEVPAFVQKGSLLTFETKLISIKTREEAMKEMQEMMEKRKSEETASISQYVADNKITVQPTASGLYYVEKEKGKGKAVVAGQTVSVNYKGMFLDGKVFDSSEGRSEPATFKIGVGAVIKGWDEALTMMNIGGKAILIIPSAIGYGEMGSYDGTIPPYSPLLFEVEVVDSK